MTVYPFNQVQFNIIFVLIYKLSANFKKKEKEKESGLRLVHSYFPGIFLSSFAIYFLVQPLPVALCNGTRGTPKHFLFQPWVFSRRYLI